MSWRRQCNVVHNEASFQCMISHQWRHGFVIGRNKVHSSDLEVTDNGIGSWLCCEIIIIAIIFINSFDRIEFISLLVMGSLVNCELCGTNIVLFKWFGISDYTNGHKIQQKVIWNRNQNHRNPKDFKSKSQIKKKISNHDLKYLKSSHHWLYRTVVDSRLRSSKSAELIFSASSTVSPLVKWLANCQHLLDECPVSSLVFSHHRRESVECRFCCFRS